MENFSVIFNKNVQSNLYLEVTFGTKKKWSYKTGEFLKDVQLTWNFLGQGKKRW
jgi:hypothetical protein